MVWVALPFQPTKHTTKKHLRIVETGRVAGSIGAVAGLDPEMEAGPEYFESKVLGKVECCYKTMYITTCERLAGHEHLSQAEMDLGLTSRNVGLALLLRCRR